MPCTRRLGQFGSAQWAARQKLGVGELLQATLQRGRWSGYAMSSRTGSRAYVDLEADASEIGWYQPK
jgi:hypothetical protein